MDRSAGAAIDEDPESVAGAAAGVAAAVSTSALAVLRLVIFRAGVISPSGYLMCTCVRGTWFALYSHAYVVFIVVPCKV